MHCLWAYRQLWAAINEETTICLLRGSVWIIGPHYTLNRYYEANFAPMLQPNLPVKSRSDLNMNFRMLEINQPDFYHSAFLLHFFRLKMQGCILARPIRKTCRDSLETHPRISSGCPKQLSENFIWLFDSDKALCLNAGTDVANTISVCPTMQMSVCCSCEQSFLPSKTANFEWSLQAGGIRTGGRFWR